MHPYTAAFLILIIGLGWYIYVASPEDLWGLV